MEANGHALRVLCLEDDAMIRHLLGRALAGYDVEIVTSVAEAKKRIEDGTYTAWLLDIVVPDGSGLDVLAWARLRGDRTPALVMTGRQEPSLANSAQILGAEFLYKPYRKAHLDSFLSRATRVTEAETPVPVRRAEELIREHGLTPREGDIVFAIARGVPRSEIAGELQIAESTVKTLVHRLLARTSYENLDEVLRDLLRRS